MPRFDKHNAEELKVFLYNSYVHDAKLENIGYECGEDILKIKLFNPIFDVKIGIVKICAVRNPQKSEFQ